jgi:hypothetical protein
VQKVTDLTITFLCAILRVECVGSCGHAAGFVMGAQILL